MRQTVKDLLNATGMIDVKVVLRLAGQLSWASGLFRWLRSFNRHLWAALANHDLHQARRSSGRRPAWMFP
eukprot:283622-Amphidinium_carterae.1